MFPFKLNGPVGPDFDHDLTDVQTAKSALIKTGHFKTPDYGLTPYPDQPLFEGIKSFQTTRGLKVDGVMKPGGETAQALAKELGGTNTENPPIRWASSRGEASNANTNSFVASPDPDPKPYPNTTTSPTMPVSRRSPSDQGDYWWRSADLPKVGAGVDAANRRTTDHLGTVGDQGDLPNLYADSIRTNGRKAVAEFADLLRKVEKTDPKRAATFAREVTDRLAEVTDEKLIDDESSDRGPNAIYPGGRGEADGTRRAPDENVKFAGGPVLGALPWAATATLSAAAAAGLITQSQEKRYRESFKAGGEAMEEALKDLGAVLQHVKPGAIKGGVFLPRTDQADPPPPVPPSEPDDEKKSDRTDSLVNSLIPVDGAPLPSPREIDAKLEGFPDKVKGIAQVLILESRGKPKVKRRNIYSLQKLLDEVRDRESVENAIHLSGTWSKEKGRLNEKLRGPSKGVRAVRADGEIETRMKDQTTRRDAIQTVDTYADNETLKPREADAEDRLYQYMEEDKTAGDVDGGDVLALAKLPNLSDEEFHKIADEKIVEFVDRNFGTARKKKKRK